MNWAARTKAIKIGDQVCFSRQFLQNTDQFTGAMPAARGVVIGLTELDQTTLADIDWQDHEIPPRVNVANLSRVTQRGGIIEP